MDSIFSSWLFDIWWADWDAFMQMGRHGLYVWSSVACVLLALVAEQMALRQRARKLRSGAPKP
jgi:heme exporter protein D